VFRSQFARNLKLNFDFVNKKINISQLAIPDSYVRQCQSRPFTGKWKLLELFLLVSGRSDEGRASTQVLRLTSSLSRRVTFASGYELFCLLEFGIAT
jgi:hypothetical protein